VTEREKLLSGEFYDSRDPELLEMYYQAKELLRE
jgi:maltose O-acetyltransferase